MDVPAKVLVTVGTTEFDSLISYTLSQPFLQLLSSSFPKYSITYQIGSTGKIIPQGYSHFRLSDKIHQIYDNHDVILTHGGAGTLLYFLCHPKPNRKIIAVANDTLAGNHQTELISKLESEGYLLGFSSVSALKDSSQNVKHFLSKNTTKPYEKRQDCLLNKLIFEA